MRLTVTGYKINVRNRQYCYVLATYSWRVRWKYWEQQWGAQSVWACNGVPTVISVPWWGAQRREHTGEALSTPPGWRWAGVQEDALVAQVDLSHCSQPHAACGHPTAHVRAHLVEQTLASGTKGAKTRRMSVSWSLGVCFRSRRMSLHIHFLPLGAGVGNDSRSSNPCFLVYVFLLCTHSLGDLPGAALPDPRSRHWRQWPSPAGAAGKRLPRGAGCALRAQRVLFCFFSFHGC